MPNLFTPCTRSAALAAALPLVAGACGGILPGGDVTARDTLYIGVAVAGSALTTPYGNGVVLAVDHLNADRPRGAPPFAVRPSDESTTSQVAVAAAFRDDPAVIGVVGHTGSGQTLEAAPVYGDVEHGGRNAVVAVSPTATNPVVTRASSWVFRVCPTDVDAAEALARYAADTLGIRRVEVVYRNDLFGRGFLHAFAPVFERAGGRILLRDPYLAGITEFEAYAARVARRGDVDGVILAGGGTDALAVLRALRGAGVSPAVLGTDDLSALNGDTASVREARGVRYTAFFLADRPPTAAGERFVQEYRRRFGAEPDHRAALSYDAAVLIGRAALEAGPERRAIRDWLASVGNDRPALEGVAGEIRFDEWGDVVNRPIFVTEVGR